MSRPSRKLRVAFVASVLVVASTPAFVAGHEHHASLEDVNSAENALKPLGSRLWYHIAIQSIVWTFLFPLGMVLGLTRSRWHVPVVSTATLLSLFGLYFGHHHDGRDFPASPHGTMGSWLTWIMLIQAGLGTFLKMHVMEGTMVRRVALLAHGFFGKIYPLLGFFQMLMGVTLGLGFCYGGHFGQCLAHFGFGSAFMAYAILTLIMSFFGRKWLAARNISQEFLDGCIFLTFGIIITFTMHGFIEPVHGSGWSHKDLQHTALGLLFWSGGALSMWMGRNGKRNIWPALVVMLTGLGMAGHGQATELSTNIHTIFGYTLVLAGVCRIIEISFVLKGQHSLPPSSESESTGQREYDNDQEQLAPPEMSNLNAFQHTMPFFLIAGGLEFMGATEEGISLVAGIGMDHVTYIIGLFCIALTMYFWLNMLLALWATSGRNAPVPSATRLSSPSPTRSSSPASWLRALLSSVSTSEPTAQKVAVGYSHLSRDDGDASMEMGERGRLTGGSALGAGYRLGGGSARAGMPPTGQRGSLSEEEDDGGDSYWDGATRVDDDAKSLQVR